MMYFERKRKAAPGPSKGVKSPFCPNKYREKEEEVLKREKREKGPLEGPGAAFPDEPQMMLRGNTADFTRYMATRWPPSMLTPALRRRAAKDPALFWCAERRSYSFRPA